MSSSDPDLGETQEPKTKRSQTPSAGSLLDSIFRKDGPMPPASIRLRALAFFLDFVLVSIVGSVIIWKIALPQSHPEAWGEFTQYVEQFMAYFSKGGSAAGDPPPEASKRLLEALAIANELQMICFWLYFAIGEAFFAGSSLGKRICRIRSVSTITLGNPPIVAGIVRGGLKTLTLYLPLYIGMIATLVALFFNKRKQMGHDLMSRTVVVDEKYANLQPPA